MAGSSGHPRLSCFPARKDVDARHKAGHDELHSLPIVVFVVSMIFGMLGYELSRTRSAPSGAAEALSITSRADG
jgi:hypothetical protein